MLKQLLNPFSLKMKYVAPLHYISFNGKIDVLTTEEIEDIECALTDILHGLSTYRRQVTKDCNTLQDTI